MPLVGQHQHAAFVDPQDNTTAEGADVYNNDNSLRTATNAHDNNPTVHVQSGALASRPAFGNQGAYYISLDAGVVRAWYDSGAAWIEVDYARLTHTHPASAITAAAFPAGAFSFTDALVLAQGGSVTAGGWTITDGGLLIAAGGQVITAGNLQLNGGQAVGKRVDDGDSGAAKTFDMDLGNHRRVRLTANCTFTINNLRTIGWYSWELVQDGTGSRLVTWPAAAIWGEGGTPPVLTTTANRKDVIAGYYNGVKLVLAPFTTNVNDTT